MNCIPGWKTPADLPPVRHALLVQLSWADRLKTEQIIELLEGYRRKIEERVAVYGDQNQAQFLSLSRTPREKVSWESILENGITSYQAELDWVRRTINKLEKFE
ncbi:hypothetical protein [Alkalihalobacillus sp. LMS39]|uniref:hypothetical protein n=1 Tax=Alkalihalobacillus sp. LMS39 TaxID=2924032 RepID=UPI001FB52CCD|nr:hypothetical protein [Alkalihalobacillus sp. LMS39]UOE94307.1 hypothetical protein MM271_01060 [Alkalihalobacillus sp. LMS39]